SGSPLFDISGYRGAVPRSVVEKSTSGGDVSLLTPGDVIIRSGALIDVSGGGYRYNSGRVQSTRLTSNGVTYDIGTAPEELRYDALLPGDGWVVTDSKWGTTQTFFSALNSLPPLRPALTEGKAAGSITLDGASVVINGELRANTVAGARQTASGALPGLGKLIIGVADTTRPQTYLLNSARFVTQAAQLPATFRPLDPLPQEQSGVLELPVSFLRPGSASGTDYLLSGFGSLSVAVNDALDLGAGLTMSAPVGGSIALTGSRVTIAGTVSAPSGSIAISGTQGTPMV